ncbi:MAG: GAF domain-containing protein [Anaerolineae bacterium]
MSKERISSAVTDAVTGSRRMAGDPGYLSSDQLRRILRIAALIVLPLWGLVVLDLYGTPQSWLITLAGGAFALLVIGAFLPLPRTLRAWTLPVALFLLGSVDLLVYGWTGSGRVIWLAAAAATGILLNGRSGAIILAAVSLLLLGYVVVSGVGQLVPVTQSPQPPLMMLIAGWGIFGLSGAALIVLLCQLVAGLQGALAFVEDEAQLAAAERDEKIAQATELEASVEALERRNAQLEASLSVTRLFSIVFDPEGLLNRASELISDHFGFDHVAIYLMNETGEWAVLRAASSVPGKELVLKEQRVRRGEETRVGWVAEHRQPRQEGVCEQVPASLAVGDFPGSCSFLALPLVVNGQLLGILDLQSSDESAFLESETEVFARLGEHLALAINNAQRLADEVVLLEKADPFYAMTNQLATARSEAEVYQIILNPLVDYNPSRILVVRSFDDSRDLYVVVDREAGVPPDALDDALVFPEKELVDLQPSGLVDLAIIGTALDAPLWAENLWDLDSELSPELRMALESLAESSSVGGLSFIPIRSEPGFEGGGDTSTGGNTLGGIIVLYGTVHRFMPMERQLHRLLTELAGPAIERSRLLADAQTRLEQEQLLFSIGQRLRASFDPDAILRTTLEELGTLLDAELAVIEIKPEFGEPEAGSGDGAESGERLASG